MAVRADPVSAFSTAFGASVKFGAARRYTLLFVLFLAVMVVPFATRKQSDWDDVYVPSAKRLLRGDEIYQGAFVYPPVNAWVALPFVGMPRLPARLLWFAVCAGALLVLVRGAWRLSGGGALDGSPGLSRREHLVFGLGLLCAIYFAFDVLANQQTDLVVAALIIVGCTSLVRGKDMGAGVSFGLAAGLKCTPLLWCPYLLWKRHWFAAALVPVVALGMNLLPDMTHQRAGDPRIEAWAKRFLLPMSNKTYDLGMWACAVNFNHSIAGVTHRLLAWELNPAPGVPAAPRTERLSADTLKKVALGGMLLFVVAAMAVSIVSALKAEAAKQSTDSAAPSRQALEFGLVLILMLLLSPQSSKPHFCTLLLPGFCLARAALTWPSRPLLILAGMAALCGLASNRDLVGPRLYEFVIWHGSVTLSAVFLFVGSCLALVRYPRLRVVRDQPFETEILPLRKAA